MDPIVNRWSSCLADHYSSSESSEDEFSDEEFIEEEEEAEDFLRVDEVSCDSEQTVKETTRVSKSAALAHLKRNGGDIERTVTEMLSEISHDSLNHLSSQGEAVKQKKVRNLTRRLERLRLTFNKHNTKARAKEGLEDFLSESQESFVEIVKVEKKAKEQLKENDDFEMEDVIKTETTKQFRKPFNNLKSELRGLRTDKVNGAGGRPCKAETTNTYQKVGQNLEKVTYTRNKFS